MFWRKPHHRVIERYFLGLMFWADVGLAGKKKKKKRGGEEP